MCFAPRELTFAKPYGGPACSLMHKSIMARGYETTALHHHPPSTHNEVLPWLCFLLVHFPGLSYTHTHTHTHTGLTFSWHTLFALPSVLQFPLQMVRGARAPGGTWPTRPQRLEHHPPLALRGFVVLFDFTPTHLRAPPSAKVEKFFIYVQCAVPYCHGSASTFYLLEMRHFFFVFFFVLFCCIANRPKWVGEWSKQKVFLVVLKYVACTKMISLCNGREEGGRFLSKGP